MLSGSFNKQLNRVSEHMSEDLVPDFLIGGFLSVHSLSKTQICSEIINLPPKLQSCFKQAREFVSQEQTSFLEEI